MKLSEAEKIEMLQKHVREELAAFTRCYKILKDQGEVGNKEIFEAFLLHARNLQTFFKVSIYQKRSTRLKRLKNDVVAEEFIGKTIPISFRGNTLSAINRQLQHISWHRLSTRKKQRNLFQEEFEDMYKVISKAVIVYDASALEEYRLSQA